MSAFKRSRQPKMTTQALLGDLDLDESSSDSDFRIEDHNASDDGSDVSKDAESVDGSSDSDDSGDEEADESEDSTAQLKALLEDAVEPKVDDVKNMLEQINNNKEAKQPKGPIKPICCVCLGDRSDDSNEIIECDGCRMTVHEGCYGVSDTGSISSTNSTNSTTPWFCEACRAGVRDPNCELCPNKGGIFKETDVGKWVHLVCALYVPGVAFGEVDQLSSVTLFEMPYTKWGAKICSLCENSLFATTGVCIGCDAGMCKTFFHVTCAQAAGFLTEAHHDTHEADAADPFYAHCKVHSEKEIMKKRKRNFHTFRLNMQQKQKEILALKLDDPTPAQMRIERKLLKSQRKYAQNKELKATPWVPTQKMSRLLTTSASACKRLLAKAAIMAVDVELLERQEAQIAALTDIRKKWHIAPAFSVEFIGYYLDRISRTKELKQQLGEMVESNTSLAKEQDSLRKDYDARLETNKELKNKQESLTAAISQLQKQIIALCPSKNMPSPTNIGRAETAEISKTATPPTRPISVPTAAALKMGVGFPLSHLGPPGTKVDSARLLSTQAKSSSTTTKQTPIILSGGGTVSAPTTPTLGVHNFNCGICKGCNDQHLLVKCDTCKLHYHLGCLNPPLTRPPKKSKLYGWQCSECDKSDDSDQPVPMPKGPRKSRTRFNKDGIIVPVEDEKSEPPKRHSMDSTIQVSGGNFKRQRLSESDIGTTNQIKLKSESPAKLSALSPTNLKNDKSRILASPPKPIKADLTSDDCVVLVLPPAPTRVLTANDADPLALPSTAIDGRQARKQKRKEKHRNKHNLSSDTERSSIKEHKRKHKKKIHNKDVQDLENPPPNETGNAVANINGASKHQIKIKLKAPSKPGEVTPEVQFLYVSADMVRSAGEASRPTSVETVEELTTPSTAEELSSPTKAINKVIPIAQPAVRRLSTPRKAAQRHRAISARPRSLPGGNAVNVVNLNCCVCHQNGLPTNTVTCDECRKNYHFTCLDPPLKKTPKIRGYSWHCADCDPTEDELK